MENFKSITGKEVEQLRDWKSSNDFSNYCSNANLIVKSIDSNGEKSKLDYKVKFEDALREYKLTLEEGLEATAYMSYIDTSFTSESEDINYRVMKLQGKVDSLYKMRLRWILNYVFN